VNSHWDALT